MQAIYHRLPIFAQNVACTLAGYKRAQDRFSPYFFATLRRWEKNLDCSLDQLYAIQNERLRHLVQHARENTEYYRDIPPPSKVADPHEAIINTLKSIPILEKSTLIENANLTLAKDLPWNRLISGHTSGTTGTALSLFCTPEALAEEYACVWRHRRQHGISFKEPFFSFGGQLIVPIQQTNPPFWRKNYLTHQTLFSIYHISPKNLDAYIDALSKSPATYIQGYPSALLLIASGLLERNHSFPEGRFKAIFTSSESLLAFHRETIEKAFNAPVRDRYGASEFAVSMTACTANRLHVDMEFGIVEVEKAEETEEYIRGPLLVTGLGNEAQPLIRYRIGDIGTKLKQPCPCGRPGEVFQDIDGRIEDVIITPSGRQIGRLDHIFKKQSDVAEAQIVQTSRNSLQVFLVVRDSYNEKSEKSLLQGFRTRLGEDLDIELVKVSSIPREPNGKFRAVKSLIKEELS